MTDLAPFNPTCDHAVNVARKLLDLKPTDVLYDIGCGDGRFLIAAMQETTPGGLRCVGIEIDETLCQRARDNVANELSDVQRDRIDIQHGDALTICSGSVPAHDDGQQQCQQQQPALLLSDCTALYLYLLPRGLLAIRPLLDKLPVKTRVVTYMFQIHGWEPQVVDRSTKGSAPVYLYVKP
jgi:SAM-dependent methyltransferase